jgi:acyl transferase domain-containing protein/short-subunit dehydrogenase/acyl carrier protein
MNEAARPGSEPAADRRVKEQAVRLLQRMQTKLDAAEARLTAPVAIVGMACRLPLGDTPEAFWTALADGRDGIRAVPPERWAAGAGAVAHGGFLADIDRFDAAFFGISPREAVSMDPQQRLALEVAWEALEHAGIAADRLEGSRTGVYLGCCTADYARLADADAAASEGYAATGGAPGVAAGRISYTLGFNGPAMVVDTACSSSLTAVHLAVQALRAGDCTLALAGGVNLTLLPQGAATLDSLHMLSPDGRCKAFDADANGFVRGEGCGVLILRLLSEAEAAGDTVLAVIRGSAVNQDGRSAGLTAPNGPAQEAVIRAALANAALTPDAVDYVEAHGTGTPLGDPIEMHALAAVFGGRSRELLVGSVKSNIGHAEAAAGIAGLIKAIQMLRHQAVPPSLHFSRLNSHIDIGSTPLAVPTVLTERTIGCVGVSSFGFSGTNAHVLLERSPTAPAIARAEAAGPSRLLLSARTPAALQQLIGAYQELLKAGVAFADLCHSAAAGRAVLPWWICVDAPEALAVAVPSDAVPPQLPPQPGRRVALPLYPFERQRYWVDESERLPGRLLPHAGAAPLFEATLLPNAPLVADHRVRGTRLLPAADMLERLRTASELSGQGDALRDVTFDRALVVDTPRVVQVSAGDPLVLFARDGDAWHRHAAAIATQADAAPVLDIGALRAACDEPLDPDAFADWLRDTGLDYGPFFDCVSELARGPSQALARLRPAPYVALLDAAIRTAGAITFGGGGTARLPAGISRYARGRGPASGDVWAHAVMVEETAGASVVDIRLFDGDGRVLAQIDGLRLAAANTGEPWRQWLHVTEWVPSNLPEVEHADAALDPASDLARALDAAACTIAYRVLAEVAAAEVAPNRIHLLDTLVRLAGTTHAAACPEGPDGALLARCGQALPGILRGQIEPRTALLPPDDLLHWKPLRERRTEAIAGVVASILPATGRLTILRVGGAAGATGALPAAFDDSRSEVWWTERDPDALERARASGSAQRFLTFDPAQPIAAQGIPAQAFDLVVIPADLHASPDAATLIDNLAQAMAATGRLLIVEGAAHQPVWLDLISEILIEDPTATRPLPPDPASGATDWSALLASCGLDEAQVSIPGGRMTIARRRRVPHIHIDTGGSAADRCARLLTDLQGLQPHETQLTLLTHGAIGPSVNDPAAATLWGMMRSLRQERPDLDIRCIDCAPAERDAVLAAERMTAEPELVFADGQRLVPRLGTASAHREGTIDPQGWVLVTGAFGGLGRLVAEWLVGQGARRLVLTGRTVRGTDWTDALRAAGAELRLEACDLADASSRAALIARLPELRGIVHAAGILEDATLAQLRPEQFAAVLAPKFDTAAALDAAFPDLDFFLLFSSAVSLFGQAGQATHVAASLGLDALATVRRARGQHAVSLGWGLWREIGLAADRATLIRRMAQQGLGTIPNDAGAAVLAWALGADAGAVTVLPIDRRRFLASFDSGRPPAALRDWRLERAVTPTRGATAPMATGSLLDLVATEAANVLGFPPNQPIDHTANLFDLGLDSLMAVELRNRLQVRVPERTLSSTLLFDHNNIAALAAHLAGEAVAGPVARAAVAVDAPIAIIGVGCRMPAGGSNPEQFWQALAEGRDGIVARPARPDVGIAEGAAKRAGYLPDVAEFDPTFFGIAPREAIFMDPQHRLVLEVAWEALEDALVPADRLVGSSTGVYLGMCNYDYSAIASVAEGADGYAGTGGAASIAAGRVAYVLGFTGPAMVVDTACSSSLLSVHLAAQALRRGECGLALAGGVNLTLGPGTTTALEQLHMLSPDWRCKAFDARANGFVRGEGCGMVVLKLLEDAEADGDRILAVVRGSAVNQDGRSAGLTAPSGPAQEAVIRTALAGAGIQPDAVDYIEAHGTGTALGDPIEMHALAGVFGKRDRPLYVGSVKTNIGHTEATAGIAGLIKAVLMLRHQAVPPSLHFEALNPHIDLAGAPITVPTALIPSPLRYAGISSFAFSGTNVHVVLERGPGAPPAVEVEPETPPQLMISARSPEAVSALIAQYRALLESGVAFRDLCHSASVGRSRLPWWVLVNDPDDLDAAQPSDAPMPDVLPQSGRRVDLPLYPFQRQIYWAQPPKHRAPRPVGGSHPILGRRLRSGLAQRQYEAVLAPDQPAWLADHAVEGRVVVPAAVLVEMMLAAVSHAAPVTLTGVVFRAMLVPELQPIVQTIVDPEARVVTILAAIDADDAVFAEIASARWATAEPASDDHEPHHDDQANGAARAIDPAELYARFASAGLAYGPAFRCLRGLEGADGFASGVLADADPAFRLDPRLLDAAWQSLAAALPPDSQAALVPVGLDRMVWFGGAPVTSALRLVASDRADLTLRDAAGNVVALCEGLRLSAVGQGSAVLQDTTWQPATAAATETFDWIDCRAIDDPIAACWRVLEAYRATGEAASPRLAVLAQDAVSVAGEPSRSAQAALVGLVTTLARERPELRPVLLDLRADQTPPSIPADTEPVMAWRDGTLLVPRLSSRAVSPAPSAPFVLSRGASATLDAARWVPGPMPHPGNGQVVVEIAATGINFRDVMNLLGVYPGDGGAPGVECAGIVAAVGENVSSCAVGDPVVAIAPGCFGSHVVADAHLVCRLPLALDWVTAAAQPVALLTARLALEEAADLQAGQRVLIHAATGGVGLAALDLARRRGAAIVGTAGSPAKRAHLTSLGVAEVYDSRSPGFADAQPVDVVLNSLTGPAIPAGLRLLKPGGVFLELGKAELWTEAQVHAVRPDVRYVVIALDELIAAEPARVGAMLRQTVAALANGSYAVPVQRYPFADVTDALRFLQAARHIGKLALSRTMLRPDAAYVITGGTGALGRQLARWLVARGARHLVMLSRHGAAVEIAGATVQSISVDVADTTAVQQALARQAMPIKGVFHLAGALHDATAAQLTRSQLEAAFATKLDGAQALDAAIAGAPLDLFVLFGSLAGVVGSAGQANYAASNAALESVVLSRRARGLPALLVDWGAWQGDGMARDFRGPAMAPEAALAMMDAALSLDLARVAVTAGAVAAAARSDPALQQRLSEAIGSAKRDILSQAVEDIVKRVLGLGTLELPRDRPLPELGLDSLMAVELRNALGAAIGRTLPTSLVFDHPTCDALCDFLAQELGLVPVPRAVPVAAPLVQAVSPADMVSTETVIAAEEADLDDDAALLLLERKLSHAGY